MSYTQWMLTVNVKKDTLYIKIELEYPRNYTYGTVSNVRALSVEVKQVQN